MEDDSFIVEGISESKVIHKCSRCLEETEVNQQIQFKDLFLKNKSDFEKQEEKFPGNIFFVENGNINLADSIVAALEEQKVLNPLCSEECKGLCPGCGINLNKAKCNCKDDNIDPRLEALKNFKI